ncbi:MAG: hypothetical protein P8X81_13680 [Woeseiaceae bacterium]|jgi:hypothetical protein
MTRLFVALLGSALFAGCANEGKFIQETVPNSCDSTGFTFVFIKYGDSHMAAKAVITVHAGAELQYRLIPDHGHANNYEEATVTITKKPSPPPASDADWVEASGTFDDDGGVLTVCVPDEPEADSYYYQIEVDGVGSLDPRADVEF